LLSSIISEKEKLELEELTWDSLFFCKNPCLGGTAIAACNMLVNAGIPMERIKLITILASMPGLQAVIKDCKGLQIWCGSVDQELKNGMIVPGLGDSGDRLFNTLG
jgi:uracil phosphoribosyltransferase